MNTESVPVAAPLPILFHLCSWHEAPEYLAQMNRQYPAQISHTVCPSCADMLDRQLSAADLAVEKLR